MKAYGAGRPWAAGIPLAIAIAFSAAAGEEPAAATAAGAAAPNPAEVAVVAQTPAPPSPAPALVSADEILKLADAGVSKEVMQGFVENSLAVRPPSARDIIALKEHSVPDDVTLALLKRGAETRARDSAKAATVARLLDQPRARLRSLNGGLDPESYEYFQHYYLFPRTLSSVYDQLGYYRPSPFYRPFSYGW